MDNEVNNECYINFIFDFKPIIILFICELIIQKKK